MEKRQAKKEIPLITAGAVGVAVAACTACCAPLLAPLVAWLGLSGLGMVVTGWYAELAVVAAIVLGGFMFIRHRRAAKRSPACNINSGCGCSGSSRP